MINKLFKSKKVLPIIQVFTLIIFALIIYGSIGVSTNDADFAKILRNTNLANLMVWSYWWPIIILTAIFFGRFWCSICPMELITSFFGGIGLKRKPSKLMKSGWFITLFYSTILIIGIHGLAIHRIPMYMSFYMLILFSAAVIIGLIWEKRTFCTYVCPIGHLLGLYSLFASQKLRVKDKGVCNSCKTKDCISSKSHYNFTERSCTSELFPPKIENNKDCILCGQCFKSCSKDNIAIQRQSFDFKNLSNTKLKLSEIAFFILISGFVVYEILSEWSISKHILMTIPNWFFNITEIPKAYHGSIKAIILFIIIPSLFFLILLTLKRIFANESYRKGLSQLVLSLLPITASMHVFKAILKTTSRIPYWEYALSDTEGIKSATQIIAKPQLIKDNIILEYISLPISIIGIILPIIGLIISLMIIKHQSFTNNKSKSISISASILYSGIFIITIFIWRFLL